VREQDEWRTDYLAERGFRLIRFSSEEALTNTCRVVRLIRAELAFDDPAAVATAPLSGPGES
jgi:very-short-patch-repair endonuclease